MKRHCPVLFFFFILFSTLSCQGSAQPPDSIESIEIFLDSPTPTIRTLSSTPTSKPTRTPSPTHTPTQAITPSPLQLQIFEELWSIVNQEYLYPDFNGLDWDAIYEVFKQRVENGLTDIQFYTSMDDMLSSLGDEHSIFLSPDDVTLEDEMYAGENDYVGIGIVVTAIPERNRAVILVTFPNGPADEAGLKSRDNILSVGGIPILNEEGSLNDLIRGPEGSSMMMTVQSPGEEPRNVNITRQRIYGSVPVPYNVVKLPGGVRIGYILLVTFADRTIHTQIGDALLDMTKETPLAGLIIDNRKNIGGADFVLQGSLSYFIHGPAGYFVSRRGERALRIFGSDIGGSQDLPLVVLIGPETVSFGEIFAGILKDLGRAYLIGEPTGGNVETLWGYNFDDGSRAWIAHDSFKPLHRSRHDWELIGIRPDLNVPVNWESVTIETDPAVLTALDYLQYEMNNYSISKHYRDGRMH